MRAEATFVIDSWQEEPYDDADGARLAQATVAKTFTGSVDGTSTARLLLATTADGPAAYTAQERFTGSVDGRLGSFVSQHGAVTGGNDNRLIWTVVAGSGTGDLAAIRGSAELVVDDDGGHHFTLDYELH